MSPAADLTRRLGGAWHGGYGTARCPAHEDRSPSLSLADGSAGRVLLKCHRGCSYAEIRSALRSLGAQVNSQPSNISDRELRVADRENAMRRARQAERAWSEAQPLRGSLAEAYFRRRGITCELPPSLAYAENCWHASATRWPALLARVAGGPGPAIHRTYLAHDGSGKAPITPAKAMLGPTKGGAVRLSHGRDRLVVTEGIETGLSLLSGLLPGAPSVWAALSAGGMAALNLPSRPGQLTIASDGDPAGHAAAEQLAARAYGLGWRVSLLPASEGNDWNDVLCGKEARA
ncbi:DUF7146 domain-containing protein [Thioclava atlantica]|uniref:Virulence-associated protein E n=1 Tax=Thioclava atlantica TaxID=1317124 RepID=A0A085TTZ6_9RHOB|nr:toprim domain-containing protein [Thioclava atlantica]KFE34193.1 virulence-associated protein E [Thioclava atlantica]